MRQVDLLCAVHVLHELEDLPGLLAQARALLRPDGRVLAVEPAGHVDAAAFAAELEERRRAGFVEIEAPTLAGRRAARLGVPDGRGSGSQEA